MLGATRDASPRPLDVHGEVARVEARRGDPLGLRDAEEEIGRQRPRRARLAERDQHGAAFAHSVHQSTRRAVRGARWRTHEHEVNPVEQIGRRLGPRASRTGYEEHATKIDAELGHRHDAGSSTPTTAAQ